MDETAKSQNINNDQLQIRSQQQKQDELQQPENSPVQVMLPPAKCVCHYCPSP